MSRIGFVATRAIALVLGFVFGGATLASAQTTNSWTNNVGNTLWTIPGNWLILTNSPNGWAGTNIYPDGGGTVVLITNNIGGQRIIYLTTNVTIGEMFLGDWDRGSDFHIRTTNTVANSITFDTGDSRQALLLHGSGDRIMDIGNGGDEIDVGISVTDAEGLFVDNWQNLVLNGAINGVRGSDPNRAFDGGGHDLTKGEDGALYFRRVSTNIATVFVRDGDLRFEMEGDPLLKPGISNVVIGVAPGVVDTGGNPGGVVTNLGEGGAYDRIQFPLFTVVGANLTNAAFVGQIATNDFDVTINRGVFRTYNRPQTNGLPPVYSGTFTLNGNANEVFFYTEGQDFGNISSTVQRTIFTGPITGSGGFTKIASGEMTLVGSNDFTGSLNINRPSDRAIGRSGGVRLMDNGTLSGVGEIVLNRNGNFFIDNDAINLSNRINDAASIIGSGRSHVEFVGNASASSYERVGAVTSAVGSLTFEFDKNNATPQAQTLEIGNLVRTPGTIMNFAASDLQQGAFLNNGPSNIVINVLDGGASLLQVGSGGGTGTVNRSVAIGVFGGDGVDFNVDPTTRDPNRSDEFMTVDNGRLRTLDPLTEMVSLGGRSTNALNITQASAASDANVNIDFQSKAPVISLGSVVNTNLIDKRVTESATFNSIRFGIVPGAGANENGRSLVMDDGVKLTSESGMILLGRDTGSPTGDTNPVGTVWLVGGTLDLDGTSNNREGIIQNMSGNSLVLRSQIEASQGLTKGGSQRVYLDNDNNIGGVVTVAQGELQLRSSGAVRGASEIRLAGDGALILSGGISVTNVDLRVTERDTTRTTLFSEGQHNVFGGDILVENVDPQGMVLHEVRIGAGSSAQTATLTLLGDIGITVTTNIMSDINLIDAQIFAVRDSGGIINLRGTFGDRLVNGEALPIDPSAVGQSRLSGGFMSNRAADENQVLRFLIDAPSLAANGDELVVNIDRSWNAAGRFYAAQGTVRFTGDPTLGQGDFWTTNALAASDFSHGFGGFQMGGLGSGESDRNSSTTLLLTRDGQSFNAERWTVANDNNGGDFTATMGLEHFGPSNSTVTIGNNWNDINPGTDDNRITINGTDAAQVREFRLLSHDGYDSATGSNSVGTVNVIQSIRGNDFSILTTVGNGRVVLGGQAVANTNFDEDNDIRNFMLLGGELVLDRTDTYAQGARRTTGSRASLTLAGGDLTYLGRAGATTEILNSNLTVRAGDSRVSVVAGSGGLTELYLATNANAIVTRQRGGTVGFVEDSTAGGTANIRLAGTGVTVGQRVGSWATYGTNYGGGAYTWAATDSLSNVIEFAEGFYSADAFGGGQHVTLETPTAFNADDVAASLRYTNAAALDLGGFSLNVTEGGILVTPTVAGAASMGNGALTSSGGELIIHNYADPLGSLAISAAITGNVDLTFSGTGKTVLTGANSFNGATRINGGTVQIDDASRLGSTVSNLELRGGILFTTASMTFTNRTIILGGDGGTFQVAAGTTNLVGTIRSEDNFLDNLRFNNGHGDLIKTGTGILALGINTGASNNLTAGFNMYQGMTDVREGTLLIVGTNNFALGSNKSFYDGTVVRGGATLTLGSTPTTLLAVGVTNTYSITEWMTFEQGSTLRVEDPAGGYQSPNINGVVNFAGDTTVFVQADEFNFNSTGAGYLMGSGDIVKTGGGALRIYENNIDFTGDLVIRQGDVQDVGYRNSSIPNVGTITLGTNGTSDPGNVAFHVRSERDGIGSDWTINADIVALGNSSDMRLGLRRPNHNDVVTFAGDIDLSQFDPTNNLREFRLEIMDSTDTRDAVGGTEYREEYYMVLAGDITGGNKRIRTFMSQEGTANFDLGNQGASNQFDMIGFFDFRGTNTGWTGSLEVGNRAGTGSTDGPDRDKQHFVRFGNNDGAATLAIGASNSVVLRHDATLQAYGSQVTIGNLFSDGNSGGDGYFGQQLVTNSFLENGGTVAGSFTINQTSNRTFNAVIRDGTYHSPTTTNIASAALSIIKAGSGMLTFDQSNYYTGTTTVRGGLLQVNGSHLGGGLYSVLAGGSLGGTGIIGSAVSVADGGTLAPGDLNAGAGGTLNINSGLVLSNNAILSFDLDGTDGTAGGGINDLVQGIGNLVLDGMLTISPLVSFSGAGTNDFWTLMTYSGSLTDNTLVVDGASQSLLDPGLAFFVYNFEGGAIDEIRLGIMVPEPSTWALLATGLGMVAWMARRRRR